MTFKKELKNRDETITGGGCTAQNPPVFSCRKTAHRRLFFRSGKRITAVLLAAAVLLMMTACGRQSSSGTEAVGTAAVQNGQETAQSGTNAVQSGQETAQSGTDAAQSGQETAAGETAKAAEIAADGIVIPENPYFREDGGVSLDVFAMDTYMSLLAYGDNAEEAVRAAAAEIHSLDDLLSTGNENSEISKLNAAGQGEASEVVLELIRKSQQLRKDSGGLFEIAIYPVMKLWGFPTQEYRVPDKTELIAALKLADASAVTIGNPAVPEVKAKENTAAQTPAAAKDKTAAQADAAAKTDAAAKADAPEKDKTAAQSDTAAKTDAAAKEDAPEKDKTAAQSDTAAKTDAAAKTVTDSPETAKNTAEEAGKTAAKTVPETEKAETAKPAEDDAAKSPADKAAGETANAGNTAETAAAENITLPDNWVSFGIQGMEIDLGGIAKGYTSSRVMEIFKEHGIKHGLVSLGGNVQALGCKENGKPWRVAIRNPQSDTEYLGILDIEDKCVITSGGYERYFEQDGVRYHHIIDPRTGYPADSGLLSATVISTDGALADGLSTSLFIMGKEAAEKYWRAHADQFEYILEDTDGVLYVTEGAAGLLTTNAKTVTVFRKAPKTEKKQ